MEKTVSKKRKLEAVSEYLKKNRLMSLATSASNKPWSATVFFAYDNKSNILFYSRTDTKHCLQINKNKNVSLVINHTWKQKDGGINGLQIVGEAKKLAPKDYFKYYKIYKKRMGWADDFKDDHRIYIIRPKEIWLIDEKLFGNFHRVKVK